MLIGSITNYGQLQGQFTNYDGQMTGIISSAELMGGQVVGMRGLKGDKGDTGATGADGQDGFSPSASVSKVGDTATITITDKDGTTTASISDGADGQDGADGADGFSPSASVSKVDNVATITITDKDGTTTAEVYDGSGGGASAFIAEYGVTTYADVKDAYDEDAIIICTVDDSGNTVVLQLAYFDDANDTFIFAQPVSEGSYWTSIAIDDTWDDGYFMFASTDTATQLRDGLMSALDWQKLSGIASGAEVNVQSDWSEADSTDDAYIKNKPTIPSKTSDLNNDSGFITGMTILSYGSSTWQNFIDAYNANKVVYCRASSNSNPGSGSQTRLAFMAYVNNATTPTEVEFQYYRSVSSHSASQQGDQVFVYKLNKTNGWSVTTREASSKVVAGTGLSSSYSSGVLTLTSSGEANVQSDWNEADNTKDDYIKNKPTSTSTPTASTIAEFDSSAHMNSTDMTTGADSELEDFIDGLNVSGGSAFLDMFYPVGSYYETSDSTFDPNVKWGGTWVLETGGQVHVSAGTGYNIGDTGGEPTHTLTVNEMPHHMHDIALYGSGYSPQSTTRDCITTNAWSNKWSLVGDYMDGVGRNDAHNNMQPYIVVNRWHRTA